MRGEKTGEKDDKDWGKERRIEEKRGKWKRRGRRGKDESRRGRIVEERRMKVRGGEIKISPSRQRGCFSLQPHLLLPPASSWLT